MAILIWCCFFFEELTWWICSCSNLLLFSFDQHGIFSIFAGRVLSVDLASVWLSQLLDQIHGLMIQSHAMLSAFVYRKKRKEKIILYGLLSCMLRASTALLFCLSSSLDISSHMNSYVKNLIVEMLSEWMVAYPLCCSTFLQSQGMVSCLQQHCRPRMHYVYSCVIDSSLLEVALISHFLLYKMVMLSSGCSPYLSFHICPHCCVLVQF